jgi:APA family basic amino acid/polyamine antiporter
MAVLVLFVDLTSVVALSTFALLFYYTITNISAYKLKTETRRYHKAINLIGLATCVLLMAMAIFEATDSAVIGIIFLTLGVIYYQVKKHLKKASNENS